MKRACIVVGVMCSFLVVTSIHSLAQEIHGCVNNKNGNLRIVSGPQDCNPRKETHISWNQQGPPGPQGAQGDEGPMGPEGPPGIGCLEVCDGSGLCLGYLVDYAGEYFSYNVLRVFNSDIPAIFSISPVTKVGESIVQIPHLRGIYNLSHLYFTSEDCSTQPYIDIEGNPLGIFVNRYADPDEYFIVDTIISPVSTGELMSRIPLEGGPCEERGSWGSTGLAFPIQSVSFPFADVELVYPITVRPME